MVDGEENGAQTRKKGEYNGSSTLYTVKKKIKMQVEGRLTTRINVVNL